MATVEVLPLIARGEAEGFRLLMERHGAHLWKIVWRWAKLVDPDDAMAAIRLKLLQCAGRWDRDRRSPEGAYIQRVAVNAILDLARRETRQRSDAVRMAQRWRESSIPSPPDELERREAVDGMRRKVRELSDSARQLIELTGRGLSYQVAADLCGVPCRRVGCLVSRARARLAQRPAV